MEYIHKWCGTPVSNRRPSAWQADALPTELVPHWVCNITFKHNAFKHSNYKMNNGEKLLIYLYFLDFF